MGTQQFCIIQISHIACAVVWPSSIFTGKWYLNIFHSVGFSFLLEWDCLNAIVETLTSTICLYKRTEYSQSAILLNQCMTAMSLLVLCLNVNLKLTTVWIISIRLCFYKLGTLISPMYTKIWFPKQSKSCQLQLQNGIHFPFTWHGYVFWRVYILR